MSRRGTPARAHRADRQDTANQGSLTDRYLALPDSATQPLKQSLLSTLGSPQHAAGSVAAQCISAVAAIELPAGKWPELIGLLLEFVQNQDNVGLRINTLQAVGYICEVIVSVGTDAARRVMGRRGAVN